MFEPGVLVHEYVTALRSEDVAEVSDPVSIRVDLTGIEVVRAVVVPDADAVAVAVALGVRGATATYAGKDLVRIVRAPVVAVERAVAVAVVQWVQRIGRTRIAGVAEPVVIEVLLCRVENLSYDERGD